jgi:subtilisin family serine protease
LTVPDAKIMPLRILNENGEGELWRITAALVWAANHNADVANLSVAYPEPVRLLKDLLDCLDVGTTPTGTTFPQIGTHRLAVTVASGNGGLINPNREMYPAAEVADGMLSVGATTKYGTGARFEELADFTSYERHWVDVTAPGVEIVSAIPGGRYGMWTGTSMASPIVAGITALVKARFPNRFPTPHDLLDHVAETSVDWRYNTSQWGEVRLHRVDALCAVTVPDPPECTPPTMLNQSAGFEPLKSK